MSVLAIELAAKLSGERERMTRYIAIAEHCPIPAFVIDTDVTTLVYVNPAFTEFTGYTLDELTGSGWHNVIYHEDLPKSLIAWEGLKKGIPVRAPRRYCNKKGEITHGVSIIERVEDNGFVGFILPQCGSPDCPVHYLRPGSWYPRPESHQQPAA